MIIVKIIGGLGNQLSQYAFGLRCAMKLGVPLKLDISAYETYKLHDYALDKFGISASLASAAEVALARATQPVTEQGLCYDPAVLDTVRDGAYLDGYWGDYRYYSEIREALLRELKPALPISEASQALGAELAARNAVAVHIRRGDYVTNSNCFLLPIWYYQNAAHWVGERVEKPHFYLFSDDPDWVEANVDLAYPSTVVRINGPERNQEDLWLMGQCQAVICANSSFSYWGAWLNARADKLVVVPSQYFKADDRWMLATYGKVVQPEYPPEWSRLPVNKPAEPLRMGPMDFRTMAGGRARGRPIRIGVWNYYEELSRGNYMFTHKDASIGAELLKPLCDLYEYGRANGLYFDTLDLVNAPSELDALLFLDLPPSGHPIVERFLQSNLPKYLCLCESEVIKPDNWDPYHHRGYERIFTWHDGWVDQVRYIKAGFVTDWRGAVEAWPERSAWQARKLCTMISGSKQVGHPKELYSERVRAIRWFEDHAPDSFDLYGVGWDASAFPSYRGRTDDKLATLRQYRFAICYENAAELPGYITEKILDCFRAGVVPVYLGAPNVTDWIPATCFIDRRQFASMEELHAFLCRMTDEEFGRYLDSIRAFIEGAGGPAFDGASAYPFSSDFYVTTLTSYIARDVLKARGERPEVSVVIPAYNYGRFLAQAVNSALDQGIDDLEVLVLDNASADDTPQVMAAFAGNPAVRYVRNYCNIGSDHNWQNGYKIASGHYVSFLSADDYYLPGHLSRLLALHKQHPGLGLAYSPCVWVEEDGTPQGVLNHPGHRPQDYVGGRNEVAELLIYDHYITPSSSLVSREALDAVGSVTMGMRGGGDWDLVIRIAEQFPDFAFVKQPGVCYRRHGGQDSIRFYQSLAPLTDHMAIVRGVLERGNGRLLAGYEERIVDHLQRRWASFDAERVAPLREEFDRICQGVIQGSLASSAPSRVRVSQPSGPLFSVIFTVYNRPQLAINALQSIVAQSFKDFEILMVNDGGVPQEALLQWLGDNKADVTYIRQPNKGQAAARNTALKLARGEYIVYLDDDDILLPEHLATLKRAIADNPGCVVYTDAQVIVEDISGGLRQDKQQASFWVHDDFDFNRLQISNYIPINVFTHPRAILEQVGGFDETLNALEDWDLLIRLSRALPFVHVKGVTAQVRHRQNSTDNFSARVTHKMRAQFREIYARYDDMDQPQIKSGRAVVLAAEHPNRAQLDGIGLSHESWRQLRALTEVDAEVLAERMMRRWTRRPQLTLLVPLHDAQRNLLANTIGALQQQLYQDWRLIVIANFEAPDPVFAQSDMLGWLAVENMDDPEVLAAAVNSIVAELPMDWFTVLPAGAEFDPDWLIRCADYQNEHPQLAAFYSDHDQLQGAGHYGEPCFKPDFNREYLRAYDYIGESLWFRQESVARIGGMQPGQGWETYDLVLRLAAVFGDAAIGHLAEPLLHLPPVPRQQAARQVLLQAQLDELEPGARVLPSLNEEIFRIDYPLPVEPLVSIIIPSKDAFEFIQPCVDSLFAKTAYSAFEVIVVDNQSSDPDVLDYYRSAAERYGARFQVLFYDAPFNFSVQCNLGAKQARGDYVLLLNNDTEIVQADWLQGMVRHGLRPDVGAVGAKLVFPETAKVQHAGILLGWGQGKTCSAVHMGWDAGFADAGYMHRLQCDAELSAATAACLLVRKQTYQELGGFDEQDFAVLYNDVDFCLRLRQAGHRLLWSAHVVVVHHHGQSLNRESVDLARAAQRQARQEQERDALLRRWLPQLARDPAYNPHLSLAGEPFDVEDKLLRFWPQGFDERPRILGLGVSGGSGEYRMEQPLRQLTQSGLAMTGCIRYANAATRMVSVVELERLEADTLVMQNAITDPQLAMLEEYARYLPGMLKIMSLDDLITQLPEKSALYRYFMANYRDSRRRLREMLSKVDRLVVSTEPLREMAAGMLDDIRVLPNTLRRADWGELQSRRRRGRLPRVGWVGAQQHQGDLALIREVVQATAHEVEWVFMGMWPEGLDHCIREKHAPVRFAQYPARMAALDLDLAVAPLESNPFNEAKSNLRLLEYGALGWPVVCSDVYPYRTDNAPVCRVKDDPAAWIAAIRERVHDLDAAEAEGDRLRQWVQGYWLEDRAEQWLAAFTQKKG